jgi:hypothetical protein
MTLYWPFDLFFSITEDRSFENFESNIMNTETLLKMRLTTFRSYNFMKMYLNSV